MAGSEPPKQPRGRGVHQTIHAPDKTERLVRAQAQKLGTWDTPKPAPITDAEIDVLAEALSGSGKALTNFLNMSASVKRTYAAFYLSAKAEDTRRRRLDGIIERLKENKKPM